MTNRKPLDLSWESYVEQQIREAQEAGEFDNLPGAGKPIPGIDEPLDEWWWIKQRIRREKLSLLPPGLQIRVDVEKTLARIESLLSEDSVRREVTTLNEKICRANRTAVWGPPSTTMPLDVEVVVQKWRQRSQE